MQSRHPTARHISTLLALPLLLLLAPGIARSQSSPKKSASNPSTGARPTGSKTAQPALVRLPITKCLECKTTTRRRVAVMPIKVGALSAELQLPGNVIATKVRDQLEAKVSERPSLLAVSRAELGDVLAEQKLTATAGFNQELSPKQGKLIPAQMLLVTTIDRVDVSTSTRQETSSTAESYIKKAVELENQARVIQDEARRVADNIQEEAENRAAGSGMLTQSAEGLGCTIGGLLANCKDPACFERQQRAQEECQAKAERDAERAQQRAVSEARGNIQGEINEKRGQARELQTQAANLRRQADIEAQKDVRETRTTTARLVATWKAIDVSTSAVVASGSIDTSADQTQSGVSRETAFASSKSTESARYDVLINQVIGDGVAKLATEVESKLEEVPFRAKVVKVDKQGITINAGKNLGVGVGDTFGVREKREVLTDPDTGLPLDKPGPPIGRIRVSEVFEKTAFAQMVERAAKPLGRGDELEWIGMYVKTEDRSETK